MLGLPASVKAPALAATGGRAVAQLIAPWFWVITLSAKNLAENTNKLAESGLTVIKTPYRYFEIYSYYVL